jgi:prefoldin subunit 5
MREIIMSWLLGIAFGAIIVSCYYDGVVANDYKKKISEASKALERAHKEIQMKDQDITILLQYLEELKKRDKRLQKQI